MTPSLPETADAPMHETDQPITATDATDATTVRLGRFGVRREDRGRLARLLSLSALSLVAGLVTPWLLARVVDDVILANQIAALPWLASAFLLALVVEEALGLAASLGRLRYGLAAAARLRARVLGHYLRLRADRYAAIPAGEVVQHVGEHATAVQYFVSDVLVPLPVQIATVVVILALLVVVSPPLALVAVAALPVVAFAAARLLPAVRTHRHAAAGAGVRTMGLVQELLGRGRTLRIFGRTDWAVRRYDGVERDRGGAMARLLVAHEGSDRAARLGTGVATLLVLVVGAILVRDDALTLGGLLAFNALLLRLFGPLRGLVRARAERHAVGTVLARIEAFLCEPAEPAEPEGDDSGDGGSVPLRASLRLRGVHFGYDRGPDILRGVDMELRPGDALGVVGESGAGKSMLLDIVARLQEPTAGAVLIDDRAASEIGLAAWRRSVRLLEQDAPLVSGTVRANLALGLPPDDTESLDGPARDGTSDRLDEALRAAGLAEMVAALPHGIDTPIGEGGAALSGGEQRRLALARALVSRPAVLLLDEPFAGLDDERRAAVRTALDRLRREAGVAIVLVSHELRDVAALTDRILVLHEGRIAVDAPADALTTRLRAHDRVAFPDAIDESPGRANAALEAAGIAARLRASDTGGWATEVERTRIDPLAVIRIVREAVPDVGRAILERATLRSLLPPSETRPDENPEDGNPLGTRTKPEPRAKTRAEGAD